MKVENLSGAALDWAVAMSNRGILTVAYGRGTIKGTGVYFTRPGKVYVLRGFKDTEEAIVNAEGFHAGFGIEAEEYSPSTDWAQGGPIIEREEINVERGNDLIFPKGNEKGDYYEPLWLASYKSPRKFHGTTPLIAAMRCYVGSKLGDDVDIPAELL